VSRIDIRDLHAALEVRDGEICKYLRIDPQGLKRISRECAASEHFEAGQCQSLRTANGRSGFWVVVAPRRAGAGVEEGTDDRQIEFRPGAGGAIGPAGLVGDISPAIVPIGDEMSPTRMKGHVERGISLARYPKHQIDRRVHAIEVDAEVRKLVFKADREHAMGALADRPGA